MIALLALAVAAEPLTDAELRDLLEDSARLTACEAREVVLVETVDDCRGRVLELHGLVLESTRADDALDEEQVEALRELAEDRDRTARKLVRARAQRNAAFGVVAGVVAGLVVAVAVP